MLRVAGFIPMTRMLFALRQTTDLRVDLNAGEEADIIVVPTGDVDGSGVRIGEVRLLTSNEETPPEEYYVIGTTGKLSATDTVATAVLAIDGVEYLRFTSDKAGAEGNGQEIRFEFSDSSTSSISSSVDNNGVIIISITSTTSRDTVTDGTVKAVNDLIDVEYIGDLKDAGFFDASLFDGRVITLTLSGGEDFVQTAPTPATGTEVSTPEVLTWQKTITKIHDYQINLESVDELTGKDTGSVDEGATEATAGATATGDIEVSGTANPAPTIRLDGDGDGGDVRDGSVTGAYGTMALDEPNGRWTYTLDNTLEAVQALGVGDTLEETFTFRANGTVPLTVTITINGTNDAPTLVDAGTATRNMTVGEAVTDITQAYLLGLFNDIDGDALTLTVTFSIDLGLSYNSTDGITSTPTKSGITIITIEANDGNSGTVQKTLEIIVREVVDADTADPVMGTLGLSDPVLPSEPIGTYGTMTLASGTWTYTLNTATTQALKAGEEVTETFTFTNAGDQETELVVIAVVGVNDNPVAGPDIVEHLGTVGQYTSIDLSGLFTDVDAGDILTLAVMVMSSDSTARALLDTIGLAYDSDTKMITGMPDTAGTHTIVVVAEDGEGGIATSTFDIVVVGQTIEATAGGSTATVTEDDETQDSATGTLGILAGVTSPAIVLKDATDDDSNGTFVLEAVYGRMEFVMSTGAWTYTLDNTKAETQALNTIDVKEEVFTFTSGSAHFTVTITVNGEDENQIPVAGPAIGPQSGTAGQAITPIDLSGLFTDADDDELTLSVTVEINGQIILNSDLELNNTMFTGTLGKIGTYTITVTADDGKGGSVSSDFTILVSLDVTGHTKVSGNGSIGNTTATTPQFLVGGDPAQTIDNGTAGDVILGGKGSDNIRLERVGTTDTVIYRYDGENKSNLATQDGSDTINSFEVGKDILVLAHLEGTGSSFNTAAEFFEALKGVSLRVSSGGNIDSIVFTFTDRDTPAQDIDLRINFFANVDSPNLDATFNVADSSGKRTIKTGQETAAYEVINQVFGESLALIDFADIGFEL